MIARHVGLVVRLDRYDAVAREVFIVCKEYKMMSACRPGSALWIFISIRRKALNMFFYKCTYKNTILEWLSPL
jgi:hypothetical protein